MVNYFDHPTETLKLKTGNQMEPVADENQKVSEKIESQMESEANNDQLESVVKEDPFAYLDRDDFTSEKYKMEIRNLPKHYGIAVSKMKLYIFNVLRFNVLNYN